MEVRLAPLCFFCFFLFYYKRKPDLVISRKTLDRSPSAESFFSNNVDDERERDAGRGDGSLGDGAQGCPLPARRPVLPAAGARAGCLRPVHIGRGTALCAQRQSAVPAWQPPPGPRAGAAGRAAGVGDAPRCQLTGPSCQHAPRVQQGLLAAVARPAMAHAARSFSASSLAERVALHHGKPDKTMQKMIDEGHFKVLGRPCPAAFLHAASCAVGAAVVRKVRATD